MPNFVGEWFLRNDVPELQEYYHASMLALLTPWRHVEELKPDNGTFKGAFDDFVAKASPATIRIMENIQYQYKCLDSAKKKRDQHARDDKERSTAGCNIRKFFRRLYAVVVVTSVASCSHGHAINYHIRRGREIDHNFLDDCNLVAFSLYTHSSIYNFFTSLILATPFYLGPTPL